jgi:hypothetical protein
MRIKVGLTFENPKSENPLIQFKYVSRRKLLFESFGQMAFSLWILQWNK